MKQSNSISIGNAGEYFVAGELERRGFSVAIPMSNTELFDILALNRNTLKQYIIQVKTTHKKKREWILSVKNEKINDENIFYVFVYMHELNPPEYHIIPSKIVAEQITNGHIQWLNTPGKNGRTRNDGPMRTFCDCDNKYLNRWDLLQ